jgi:fructose-specific phosphotransferase system IIC component
VHPLKLGGKEQAMESGFLWGILIGFVAGGGGVWYFKVLALQKSVLTMTSEYQRAEKGRRDLEAKSRAY